METVPPRDKRANEMAERAVGIMEEFTNVAMLAPFPPVSQLFWDHAMIYSAHTKNFNFNKTIYTSPYKFETSNDIDIKKLHGFFDKCWILIDPAARAEKGCFLGYYMTTVQFHFYLYVKVTANARFSNGGMSKDLLLDSNLIMNSPRAINEEPFDREFADPASYVPAAMRQTAPIPLRTPQELTARITPPPIVNSNSVLRSKSLHHESLKSKEKDNTPKEDSQVQFANDVSDNSESLVHKNKSEPDSVY